MAKSVFPLEFPFSRAVSEPSRDALSGRYVVGAMMTPSHAPFGERLAASCRVHGLPLALYEVPVVHRSISVRGADDLRFTKANFIHFLQERYGCAVLYLDVDCVIARRPARVDELLAAQVDFAIFNWLGEEHTEAYIPQDIVQRDGHGQRTIQNRFYRFSHSVDLLSDTQLLCSGAVQWYAHSDAARLLLKTWHEVIQRAPGSADDKCLDLAFNNYPTDVSPLKATWLEKRYARYAWWIYEQPVIDHPDFPSSGKGFAPLDELDGKCRIHEDLVRESAVNYVFPKDCLIDVSTRTLIRSYSGIWRAVGTVSVPLWLSMPSEPV